MKNILLIDDDEIIQKVLNKVLLHNNFNVVVGANGREGISKLDLMHFDLVITDIMMPYLNGFEFIQALKQHPNSATAKVMVISSITHEASINDSMNLGVDIYVPKPIIIEQFLQKINHILQ